MLTDDQLDAMTASAPLLVQEYRKLDKELHLKSMAHDECVADIHRLELQLHDNQSLREDYEALLKKYDEATEAFKLMKDAAHRDEETIRELKAKVGGPIERSETFKEVRTERDQALKKVALLSDTIKELQAKVKALEAR